jgi:CheY-like chemotaxis protein
MKKVEVIVADDDSAVRETFNDLVKNYRGDLAKSRRDDHLGYLFNEEYEILFDEAKNGFNLEKLIDEKVRKYPDNYFIVFVDEDMPVKKGTDAISGITDVVGALNQQYSLPKVQDASLPKVRFVSYTKEQDLETSEGAAKESGASLFLSKTGLDDFYEDMIRIVEHQVLDLANLEQVSSPSGQPKATIKVIGSDFDPGQWEFREYLHMRYCKEALIGLLTLSQQNSAWMSPDLNDFFSLPLGIYVDINGKPRLVACMRLLTSQMQSRTTLLLEEILSRYAGRLTGIAGSWTAVEDDAIRLDKFHIDKAWVAFDVTENLLIYATAMAMHLEKKKMIWEVDDYLLPLAMNFGFTGERVTQRGTVVTEFNLEQPGEYISDAYQIRELIEEGEERVFADLVAIYASK